MSDYFIYRQCPKCGNSPLLESEEKFCFRDGTKLVAKSMTCSCGGHLDWRKERFCPYCGLPARDAKVTVVEV